MQCLEIGRLTVGRLLGEDRGEQERRRFHIYFILFFEASGAKRGLQRPPLGHFHMQVAMPRRATSIRRGGCLEQLRRVPGRGLECRLIAHHC